MSYQCDGDGDGDDGDDGDDHVHGHVHDVPHGDGPDVHFHYTSGKRPRVLNHTYTPCPIIPLPSQLHDSYDRYENQYQHNHDRVSHKQYEEPEEERENETILVTVGLTSQRFSCSLNMASGVIGIDQGAGAGPLNAPSMASPEE